MAEAIFNKLCSIEGVLAFSAGLSVVPESITSKNSALLVKENLDIDLTSRKAVQLNEKMIEEAEIVLTMTSYMADVIKNKFKEHRSKVYSLNEYISVDKDITDPYGGDISIYTNTFNDLKESIEFLIKKLQDKGID